MLEQDFEKLGHHEKEGLELGLTLVDVKSNHFGHPTISAMNAVIF